MLAKEGAENQAIADRLGTSLKTAGLGRRRYVVMGRQRNGTTTPFGAMDTLEGNVPSSCMPRHRHQELIGFLTQIDERTRSDLAIHLILDNCGAHKDAKVNSWHPRLRFHSIPTSSSRLNVVERFFRELTTDPIRRDRFTSVPDLIAAIHDYIDSQPRRATFHLDRRGR